MRKSTFAIMALMLAVTTACEIKPQKTYDYEPPADKVQERDSVIFGICGGQSTQNVLQIIKDNEDTLFFNVEEARKKGMVMADYHRGEEIYVLPDSTGKVALMTINKDNLLGEWVMPSPYDGSTPSGVIIKEGGEAESFGQQGDIIYKAWRIYNGFLQLVETRDDGTDLYYTQTYDIVRMTRDSLYLRNKNEDESFEFGRYVPEPELDLGLEFDEDDSDNYGLY